MFLYDMADGANGYVASLGEHIAAALKGAVDFCTATRSATQPPMPAC